MIVPSALSPPSLPLLSSVTLRVLWSSEVPEPIRTHSLGIRVPEGGRGTKWNRSELRRSVRNPWHCVLEEAAEGRTGGVTWHCSAWLPPRPHSSEGPLRLPAGEKSRPSISVGRRSSALCLFVLSFNCVFSGYLDSGCDLDKEFCSETAGRM